MNESNPNSAEPEPIALPFRAVVMPNRSLSRRGFTLLMLTFALISFTTGVIFVLKGAWPVFGFFGLDVALLWLAFRLNYHGGQAAEIIDVSKSQLRISHHDSRGRQQIIDLDPYWARLERSDQPELGQTTLYLSERGRRVEIGAVLSSPEKQGLAAAITAALHLVRTPAK